MAESLLELRDILVRYGDKILLQVAELQIFRGEVLALLGPNGAGKSTLLRVMALLQKPNAGSVSFCGIHAGNGKSLALRRRIAVVFQEPLLLNQSVRQNVSLGLRLRGLGHAECDRRIRPWLERFGIAGLANRPARGLSGGEAQRASLARAFAIEPELLLLDEPFSALDPASREELLGDFYRIVKESRTTTVLVSHERRECFGLADRVAVLQASRMLQIGSPQEVFFRPASESVAEIVGMENRIRGVVLRYEAGLTAIKLGAHEIYAAGQFSPGSSICVCIRPEEITLVRSPAENSPRNQLSGRVSTIQPGIEYSRIALSCGSFNLAVLTERNQMIAMNEAVGDMIGLSFSPTAVHVIEAERNRSDID